MKFSIPPLKKNKEGCIYSFDNTGALEKIKEHNLDMNERGELYTWSFVKDNILLVITCSVPAEDAGRYESALNKIRK